MSAVNQHQTRHNPYTATHAIPTSAFKTPGQYRLLTTEDSDDDDSILGDMPVLSSVANELLAEESSEKQENASTRAKSRTPSSVGTKSSNGTSIHSESPDFHTAKNFVTPAPGRNMRRAYLSSTTRGSGGSSGESSAEKKDGSAETIDESIAAGHGTVGRTVGSVARMRPTTSKRTTRMLGLGMPIRGPRRDFSAPTMDGSSPDDDGEKRDYLADAQIKKERDMEADIDGDGDVDMGGNGHGLDYTRQKPSPNQYNPLKRQSSASFREQALPAKRMSPSKPILTKATPPKIRDFAHESPVEVARKQQEQASMMEIDSFQLALNRYQRSASRSSEKHPIKFTLPRAPSPSLDKENARENMAPPTFKRNAVSPVDMVQSAYLMKSKISPPVSPIRKQAPTSKPQLPPSTTPRKPLGDKSVNTPHRTAPPPPPKMSAIEPVSHQASTTKRKRQHVIVNNRQYLRLDQIGRGGSAKVYKVMAEDYRMLAMKKVTLEKQDEATIRGFKGEIDLLQKLRDVERVVRLFDYEINDERSTLTVLLECGESDLNKIITSRHNTDDSALDISFIRHYWKEMLECVDAVHQNSIVHSDLKPANFLLVQGRLKLIDFGIANAIQDDTVNVHREHQVGTVSYMAPETIVDFNAGRTTSDGLAAPRLHKLGAPSDVWSLGCILYQMTYGRTPFAHLSTLYSKMAAIPDPKHEIEYASTGIGGTPVPAGLIATMKGCLDRDKDRRLTIRELLSFEDPFLNPDRMKEGVADISEDVLISLMENVADFVKKMGTPSEGQIKLWAKDVFGKLKKKMFERAGSRSGK